MFTVFGEQKKDWELAPAGNKFKERTRIANYTGMPELMSMFKQVADIRTADTLNLEVPECEEHIINVEATDFQKLLVEELAERADEVQAGIVEPTDDNMLRITSDGRKLGLDPRLIDPTFEDNPNTKLNQCVNNVFDIYMKTNEQKSTQIVFCDLGVPHGDNSPKSQDGSDKSDDNKSVSEKEAIEEECDFCIYDDIKAKLIEKGVPENEIAFIHSAKTEKQKAEMFNKVNKGEIRVILGSTSKMGTGTNIQKKLIAVHDLDIPWRPADLDQRRGRVVRQGNENKNVHVFRYVTKGTFDAYSYQTLECKQKFISQIMTSKTPMRNCEDVDQQALTYSEIKALCTGDERIKEKMQLENEVKELRLLNSEYKNTKYELEDKVRKYPELEARSTRIISNLNTDREHISKLPIDPETNFPEFKITIKNVTYTDRKDAAKAFETACTGLIGEVNKPVPIGEFQGFPLSVTYDGVTHNTYATLAGAAYHKVELGVSFSHNLQKLEKSIYTIDKLIEDETSKLNSLKADLKKAKTILSEPFTQKADLESKEERLAELTDELKKAAAEAKKNAPDKEKTGYFSMAKLKKEAAKLRQAENKLSGKKKTVGKKKSQEVG